MRKRLLCAAIALAASVFGGSIDWSTAQITTAPSNGVLNDVIVASGPTADNVVAVWADSTSEAPFYSIYDNGTWTTGPIPLSTSTGVGNNVYVTAGPNAGELVATWKDSDTQTLYFSLYSGDSWTTGILPRGSSMGALNNVTVVAGPNSGEVTAAWADLGNLEPYYSIYDGNTWSTPDIISDIDVAQMDVSLTPGPTSGTLMATFNSSSIPMYSLYSGGSWGSSGLIPLGGGSLGTAFDVISTTNPTNGQIAAVWSDEGSAVIFYSFYTNGAWTTGAPIDMGSMTLGCYLDPYIAAETTGEYILTWNQQMTQLPYYAIYQNGTWSTGAPIPLPPSASTGAKVDVTIACVSGPNDMIAAWGDVTSNLPYYSTFVGTPVPPPPVTEPLPPTNGQGSHVKNRFALLLEWFNELDWTASISPNVTGYNIRRNGTLIAANLAVTSYQDNDRPKNGTDVYSITSVNAEGLESLTALEITVSQ